MTPMDILAWLAGGGIDVSVRNGKIIASPRELISESDRQLIQEHRDALYEFLAPLVEDDSCRGAAKKKKKSSDKQGAELFS